MATYKPEYTLDLDANISEVRGLQEDGTPIRSTMDDLAVALGIDTLEAASASASAAATSATASADSAEASAKSADNAADSETNAQTYMEDASESATAASASATNAAASETASATYYENIVELFAQAASTSILSVATAYETTTSYEEGDACIYENLLYQCTTATTGDWDATCWASITVAEYAQTAGLTDAQLTAIETALGISE